MKKIRFSFIVPVYNREKYIEKCISSILSLNKFDCEIIIVNDGSTDGTASIINRISSENKNVKVVTIENSGLSVARNVGLNNAIGEYIIFIDSDDWIEQSIAYPMALAEDNNLDVCFYNANDVYEDENYAVYKEIPYFLDDKTVYDGKEILSLYTKQDLYNEAWRGIYKRSFLELNNLKFIPGILFEDVAFWFDIMQVAKRVTYTDTYCYNYLRHSNSIIYTTTSAHSVNSVFSTMEHVLYSNCLSQNYLGFAAIKLHRLMRTCEKNIDTSKLSSLIGSVKDISHIKDKLLRRIEDIYYEDTISSVMSKYLIYSEFAFFLGVFDENIENKVISLRDKVIKCFKNIMDNWSLNDESKVIGIYGSGRNADVILDIYQKIYGRIKAKIYYIDTNKLSETEKHLNSTVINVSDLERYNIDEVIICSIRHENAMYLKIKELWSDMKINLFYNGNEFITETILTDNFTEILLNCRHAGTQKKLFLFETPEYDNIGDHLIALAEKELLERQFPDYKIVEVDNLENHFFKGRLSRLVKDEDIIVITGGGYFGSLWRIGHYDEALDIIRNYKNNFVFVMPQSVHFDKNELGEQYIKLTQKIFDRDKFIVCVREAYSYETLKNIGISEDKIMLLPDIVLSLPTKEKQEIKKTNNIGFFTRIDKESTVPVDVYERIKKYIGNVGMSYNNSSMLYGKAILKNFRTLAVTEKLNEIDKQYDLIITDQLHCMIACTLLRKPCIAFKSISKKTEGVYKWIENVNYIRLAETYEDALEDLGYLMKLESEDYSNVDLDREWFKLNYRLHKIEV